jgi:hypothetical protein
VAEWKAQIRACRYTGESLVSSLIDTDECIVVYEAMIDDKMMLDAAPELVDALVACAVSCCDKVMFADLSVAPQNLHV